MLNFVALDLETTGLDYQQDQIIEIGMVKVIDGQEVESFQTLIRPAGPLPVKIKRLTGLKDEDFHDAPKLEEVLPRVLHFIGDHPLVGHNIEFDYNFLVTASKCSITNELYDTLELSRYILPATGSHRLGDLCNILGIDLSNKHRALDDALAAAHLLIKLMNKIEEFEPDLIWQLSNLISQAGSGWYPILQNISKNMIKLFPDNKILKRTPGAPSDTCSAKEKKSSENKTITMDECLELLGPSGSMAVSLPKFKYRPQQCDMMEQVINGLNEGKIVLVEAGTGTGKSLAYLVPAIKWSKISGERVLITTHTIALQEQLWSKDLPLLQRLSNLEFQAAIMKGRSNYLCLRRWNVLMAEKEHQPEEAVFLAKILMWIYDTKTGDKSELTISYQELENWFNLCCESDGCLGNRCRYFTDKCFFMSARRKAERSDIVIVNHSLLLSDANADNMVLPSYGPLIIDEAHHLESCATDHLGRNIGRSEVLRWLSVTSKLLSKLDYLKPGDNENWLKKIRQGVETKNRCRESANGFFEMFIRWIEKINNSDGRFSLRFGVDGNIDGILCLPQALDSELDNLIVTLRTLCQQMAKISDNISEGIAFEEDIPGIARDISSWASIGQQIADKLEWICRRHEEDQVYWVEGGGDKFEVLLRSAPIDVGPILYDKLLSNPRPVILTSATLSVDGGFKHYIKSIGLDLIPPDNIIERQLDSPFAYSEQALLCVANDGLQPNLAGDNQYHDHLADAIYNLTLAAEGRTLVLFTAHRSLREIYNRLKGQYENEDICLLGHELDGSRRRLVEQFMEGKRTVLFGAASFWEGVDIPGDSLSCVIIVKLPFAPPNHPVLEARLKRLTRQGRNGFIDYQIPQAVIKFKQGFGRLIRGPEDRGAVVILDSRLVEKRYGHKFFNSLPLSEHFRGNIQSIAYKVKNWLNPKKE